MFPAPQGGWAAPLELRAQRLGPRGYRSHLAAPGGRWRWTFHSQRHVFATWALNQPGLRVEDVSRLLGHSSLRVTQDIYIHVHDDLYGRFYEATD